MGTKFQKSRATCLTNLKADPFDYQVSGLAHALGDVFGYIPIESIDKELLDKKALQQLRRVPLGASFVCHLPGIGKTLVYLMFIQWIAEYAKPEKNEDGDVIYSPNILVVPPSVITQIFGIIYAKFPTLAPILSYTDEELNKQYSKNYVSASSMKVSFYRSRDLDPQLASVFREFQS